MKAKIGYFKQCMILYILVPERVEAIVHRIANHSREEKRIRRRTSSIHNYLVFPPIDREKAYPKMCMNRITLIIEYMNAIYALKKLDNHFYPATS